MIDLLSESEFDVIVTTFDKDTYYNDSNGEFEQHPNGGNHIVRTQPPNSGTEVNWTMNSDVDGTKTYTRRIKAIKVEVGQPPQQRTDYYTAKDNQGNWKLKDSDKPFQVAVEIRPPAEGTGGGGE